MRDSAKLLGGLVAIAAPVLLGWSYTADATVAGGSIGDDQPADEVGQPGEVDEFISEVDGGGVYTINRTESSGIVTVIVAGPDGNLVQAEDYPGHVVELVEEISPADWDPGDPDYENGEGEDEDEFPPEDEVLLDQLESCVANGLGVGTDTVDALMNARESGTSSAEGNVAIDVAVNGCSDILDELGPDARAMVDEFLG